ncbi:MAG TPA: hypothetical protein VHF27_10270 [Acidimicrobiales bacterium]|nr:hypothetical protein [Acidimicrobiales bacterium]
MPGPVAVTGGDVAVATGGVGGDGAGPLRGEDPRAVDGPEHGGAFGGSKNTVNETVPVGGGPFATPVTVAVSLNVAPTGTVGVVPGVAGGETRVAIDGVA